MTDTILLTGATGLVGTYFLYKFQQRKKKPFVTAIHRGDIPEHLKEISKEGWANFVQIDLATDDVRVLASYDTIIHAATYGQPGKFMEDDVGTLKLNTSITLYLIERCLNYDGKFLFISTSEVYNGLTEAFFTENQIGTTTPYHPRACYIEGKRSGEAIINAYRKFGIDAKSVRLSLAYGEGTKKDDERVLNQFIQMGLQDGVIKMRDKGDAIRTYCYVGDAVDMMLDVLYRGKQAVYNIGGESTTTIADIAYIISFVLKIKFEEGDGGDGSAPQNTSMSIDRYEKEFGKRDFITLTHGLQRTIDYQKQLYGTCN